MPTQKNHGSADAFLDATWTAALRSSNGEYFIAMAGRGLGDEGAEAWAKWAHRLRASEGKGRRCLRTADFSNNGLTDRGFQSIVTAIVALWPEIRILKAFRNRIATSAAAMQLLQMGNLSQLHLSHNELTAEAMADLVRCAKDTGYPTHGTAPLWLRLEHNVRKGDAKLARCLEPLRKDICIVDGKTTCTPESCHRPGRTAAAVHLTYIESSEAPRGAVSLASHGSSHDSSRRRTSSGNVSQPLAGWALPVVAASNATSPEFSVDDFPCLHATGAGPRHQLKKTTSWGPPPRQKGDDREEVQCNEPREELTAARPAPGLFLPPAVSAVSPGRLVKLVATYASEGGGYLSVEAGKRVVLISSFAEAGYARDVWPEYVYVSLADSDQQGWIPWALCRPVAAENC